ncbi:MAG: glycosyltransferase involved in cell wall biosynthesis [Gammaproteobacteria bacterium]|jgi:glycosyltransferase involved in cell wall biosynthesis
MEMGSRRLKRWYRASHDGSSVGAGYDSIVALDIDAMAIASFSIITPTYNRGTWLPSAIESVLEQRQPVEHIIIDGASQDDTRACVKRYPSVRFFSEPDCGLYDAVNKGLALASGNWIGFLNSDDRLAPRALATVAEAIASAPADIEQLAGWACYRKNGAAYGHPICGTMDFTDLLFGAPVINARFFRRDALMRLGPLETQFTIAADRKYLIAAHLAGLRSLRIERVLYEYGVHDASLTLGLASHSQRRVIADQHRRIAEHFLAGVLPDRQRRLLRAWHAYESSAQFFGSLANGERCEWLKALRSIKPGEALSLARAVAAKWRTRHRRRRSAAGPATH